MIEINLVPDIKQELIRAQRIRSKVIVASIFVGFISIAVVASLAIYIFTVQVVRNNTADEKIKTGSDKLIKVTDLSKILTIQNQLTKIPEINSNKKIDSRIFQVLTAINPPVPNNVQISDLSIDSSTSTITIDGQASNSYAALETFKKTIAGAEVKYTDSSNNSQKVALTTSISTSNISYGQDSSGVKVLRFTINFVYADELFSPNSEKVSIVITTSGNATDSNLGVPVSIFADRATDLTESQ
jgi:hypothetical protein